MSFKQENNMALSERHPKRWKSRLQRFQSTLRQSVRLKKRSSPRSAFFVGQEHRTDLAEDNDNRGVKRFAKHVRRENMVTEQDNTVSHKQDNGTKANSHSHYRNRKTSLDSSSLDKRKFEKIKTNGNNNRKEKKITAEIPLSNVHVSEVSSGGQNASNLKKRSQGSKRQKANTNTERTSLSKSKSLSILTNLFKRSNHSKDKRDRGKSLSFGTSQTARSKGLSSAYSSNLDTLVTDVTASTSSIDSYGDSDSHFNRRKYYSLKRSKGSLVFPKKSIPRSFSLDNSLEPCNQPMEKAQTLAAIPPCIRVEEYRENCGVFEKACTVEFVPGSCGSAIIDERDNCDQNVTECSHVVGMLLGQEVDPLSRATPRDCVRQKAGPNISHRAAKNNDAQKRHSAPPSLLYSAHKNSSNIGSSISTERRTDIAAGDDNKHQIEQGSSEGGSKFLQQRNSSLETTDCGEIVDLKSDMGNNSSYGQKPRKFSPKDAKFKLEFLRSFKKSGKDFYMQNACDGEADPIIEESEFLESYDRELETGVLSYPTKCISADKGLTKDKSNSLYEGTEALGDSKRMIDIFQKIITSRIFWMLNQQLATLPRQNPKKSRI